MFSPELAVHPIGVMLKAVLSASNLATSSTRVRKSLPP